jgi:LIVCS family branched-chain amino acid:cation transporter
MNISNRFASNAFVTGFLDGYQTMDTIAALNFGIIFVVNVKAMGFTNFKEQKKITLKASFIAGGLLFIIYLFLGLIGKVTPLQSALNGTEILTYAIQSKFGVPGMVILAIVFILACFNTCTALITCVSEYFNTIIPSISYKKWVIFFAVSSAIISNAGLNAILKFSIPVLSAIYPLSITLIVIGLFNLDIKEDFRIARKIMMLFVALFSVIPVLLNLFHKSYFFDAFPLNNVGLVWVIPGIIGLILGYLIQKIFIRDDEYL